MIVVAIFLFGVSIGNVVINNYTNNRDIKEDNLIMAYDEVKNGENATQSEYVTFDAYFAQGSRKSRGIASELNNRPELCIDLNVLTNGRLENGKIVLESGNYSIARNIVSDNEVSSYNSNTKTISLKNIQKGTQKSIYILMEQNVIDMVWNNAYKDRLSKVNKVTFTGTHVSEDGTRTQITKTVDFTLDWYGRKNLGEIRAHKTAFIANRASNKVILEIETEMWAYQTFDTEIQAPDKAAVLTATIPTMNGVPADEVIVKDWSNPEKELTYNYNKNTRNLSIQEKIKYNSNGVAEKVNYSNRYNTKVTIIYPYSAYNFASTKSLNVTFNGYLEGYNNPNVGASTVRSSIGSKTVNVNLRNPQGDLILFSTKIDDLTKSKLRVYYDRNVDVRNGYRVSWIADVNYAQGMDGLIFEEDETNSIIGGERQYHTDHMQSITGTYYSMDDIVSYAGISVPANTFKVLGKDGFINIRNMETGNIIKTITAEEADKYIDYYELGDQINHIKIETSAPLSSGKVEIYNYKEINNTAFKDKFSKTEFNGMTLVYTSLNGKIISSGENVFINRDVYSKDYEDGSNVLYVSERMQLNTQKANESNITLHLGSDSSVQIRDTAEWVDPIFILEYPSEIDSINIKDIYTDDGELTLDTVEQFENSGRKCVKIKMLGTTTNGSRVYIKQYIRMNPRTTKTTGELRIFSYNTVCDEWHGFYTNNKYVPDIYDIDSNGITSEERCINYTELIYSKPTGLYTNTEALNFDSKGTVIMGPDIANVEKTKAGTKATVRLNIYNNYNTAVTNAKVVGKIPFKNNTYQINSGKLGSNFTTTMSNQGIILPSNLLGRVKVYYSTNEKVNSDLLDQSNNWVQNPLVWSQVKNYLIDFSGVSMSPGASYTIDYVIEFPDELNYGLRTYATHAIYFEENTANARIPRSTETNKVGFSVSSTRNFNLQITKLKQNTDNTISGVKYKVTGPGLAEGGATYTTNANGIINISKLFPEETYTIEEIYSTNDYVKSENVLTLETYLENGEVKANISGGTVKNIIVENGMLATSTVKIQLENEPKYSLELNKYKTGTTERIKGVSFTIKGEGFPEVGKKYTTDTNGQIKINGLIYGKEYSIQEVSTAANYILNDKPIIWIANRENMTTKLDKLEADLKSVNIEQESNINNAKIKFEVDNEPGYGLNIGKFKTSTDEKIPGVTFNIKGLGFAEGGRNYITDKDGNIKINGLIPGEEYVLQETKVGVNYRLNDQLIKFRTYKQDDELKLELIEGTVREKSVVQAGEGTFPQVNFDIENDPNYELNIRKFKRNTEEKVASVVFNIKGKGIVADGKNYITDEDGNIKISGLIPGEEYSLQEIKSNENYVLNDQIIKFTTQQENGEFSVKILEGEERLKDRSVDQAQIGTFPQVNFDIENEPKYELNIQKYNQSTNEKVPETIFNIKGEGIPEDGDQYTTDENGNIKISKLIPGAEYVLQEVRANDDYVINESIIRFRTYKENDILKLDVIEKGAVQKEEISQVKEGVLPQVTFEIENEARYDLNIKKYKKKTNETIDNVTFVVKGKGIVEDGDRYTTDENGYIKIRRLIPNTEYTLQEVQNNSNYMPDDKIMKFKITNNNGVFNVEVLERGNIRKDTVEQATVGTPAQVNFEIENEPKYTAKIKKTEAGTNLPLQGVVFVIKGKNFLDIGARYTTDKDGIVSIERLELGETYTLHEVYAKGYRVDETEFTIKVERIDGKLQLIYGGRTSKEEVTLVEEPNMVPVVNISFENERMPEYDLELTKVGEKTGALLAGVGFDVEGKGREYTSEISYITGEDGKLRIEGLYVGETYKLTETKVATGYKGFDEPISFRVIEENGELKFEDLKENTFKDIQIDTENKIVKVSLENELLFRLQKVDEKTGEPLEGAKYVIKELDDDRNEIGYAKNVKGEEVGQLEIIDGNEYRVVTTDGDGFVIEELAPGYYKAEEVQAPFGYDLPEERIQYFGIDKSKDAVKKVDVAGVYSVKGDTSKGSDLNDTVERIVATSDGGFLVGGYFTSKYIQIGDKSLKRLSTNNVNSSFVAKYKNDMSLQWATTFGATGKTNLRGIAETNDGGFVVVGEIVSGNSDILDNYGNTILNNRTTSMKGFIIKYLPKGDNYEIHWSKGVTDSLLAVSQTSNGDILCSGKTGFIGKYENTKGVVFEKFLGEKFTGISSTQDGGFIAGENIGSDTAKIKKYNEEGTKVWERTIQNAYTCSLTETVDGKHYVISGILRGSTTLENGTILTNGGSNDGFIISYNSETEEQEWGVSYGGIGSEFVNFVVPTKDNGIVALGSIGSELDINGKIMNYKGARDSLAIKYDVSGKIQWAKAVGGIYDDTYTCGAETIDGKIITAIYTKGSIIDGDKTLYNKTTSTSYCDTLLVELDEVIDKVALPEVKEVEFKNSKTIYKIYTRVDGEGGEIAGNTSQEDTWNEDVEYTASSKNDIEIKPYEGYKIREVTINGIERILKRGDNEGFILDKFDNVSEDKHIVVKFTTNPAEVIVHHIDKETGNPLVDDDYIYGETDKDYTTSAREDIPKYRVIPEDTVGETSGKMLGTKEVTYYYTKKDAKVTVHYYVKGAQDEEGNPVKVPVLDSETGEMTVVEDDVIDGKVDEHYETTPKDIKNYRLVEEELPANAEGEMTEEPIEVIYYYELKDSTVIVHHYEDGTTIPVAPDDNFGGKVGDSYTSSPSSKVSEEYELVEEKRPVNETVTLTEEPIEIIYYYTKRATKVIVHHYKEGTTEKLAEDVTIDGKIDSEYETHALSIKDYVVVDEEPENFKGKMTKDTIEVIYYYRLKDTKVTAHHYKYETKDDEVPESVAPDVIQEGKVGTYYVTEPRRDLKEYRVLEEEWPSNADGYMTEEPIEVIYYYVRKDASVIVHHYLDGTTEQVANDDEFNGKVGDTYTSAPKTDLGEEYELVEEKRPVNETVTLTEEPIEIIYYYRLIEFKITTEVEGEGGTISGQEDEVYEVVEYNKNSTKEIVITPDRNYRISKVTINGEDQEFEAECNEIIEWPLFTNVLEDIHVVVSFEKVNAGDVIVRYLNSRTGEELAETVTLHGEIGDSYTTDRKEIENYIAYGSDPINKNGVYIEEEQEVIYYYEKITGTVTIQYIDIDSGESLAEQHVMSDYVDEMYNTFDLRKEIDKYELVEEELPKEEGTYINGNIDVVYKYRRIPSRVIVKYLEKGTELELAEEIIVTGIEDDPYDVHDLEKTIKAYERTEDIPDNVTGEMTEQDIIVKYYYKRIQADFVENDINKEGTKKLAEKDQLVLYDISYNAEIANYLGNATVTIVDYLPYEIDLNESDIKDGNYNPEDKTITWVDTIEDIDTYENSVNRVIEITKQIKVKYINMDYSVTSFENKVKGKISLDTTKQEKETPEKIAVTETNFYKDIVVTKNWDHTNNIYGKPKAITVKLMVGEEMIDSQTLTSANKAEDNFLNENKEVWKCTFENVRKYDNLGNEINYTIDEDITEDLKYYETSYDQANATITNTYIGPVITRRKEQVTENNLEYVVEGEKITYRIVVENSGKIAKDVEIKDTIPEGLIVNSITIKDETTGELTNIIEEDLAGGITKNVSGNGKVVVTISATVAELPDGLYYRHLENTATVDGEDTETVETNVNKSKIIGEKSVKPEGPVQVGQELTYSINVKNIGTLEDEVIITDSIPDGTTYVPGSVMFGNKTYTDEELIAGVDGITLEKSIDGLKVIGVKLDKFVLDAGKNITLSFKAKVNANVGNEEKITNTAYVNEVPTTTENTVIKPIIEIKKLLKEINGQDKRLDYVFRGDTITYEIQAKNTGDLDGTVIIKDEISENVEFVSGSIKINGVPMNYTENDLLNGIEVSVPKRTEETPGGTILSFTVKVKGKTSDIDGITGDVKNIATWKYKNPLEDPNPEDPDTSREYETDEVKVPIVLIEKKAEITRTTEENQTLPENTVTAKDEIIYTIVVENTGTSATGKFVVKDDIPEGTTILDSNGGTISDKTISWTIDNLLAKEEGKEDNKVEISFTVTVKYAEVMPEKIVNIAYVNDKPTNETETPYVKPTPKMETEIVKTGDDITMAGNKVYYKMTYTGKINDFAGKACVTIVDELPYRIDKDKSELNGGKYEEDLENKKYTITWKLPAEEINTYVSTEDYIAGDEYVISAEKEVWLYYTDNLGSEFTNKAIATTQLKEPDLDNPGGDKDVGTPDIAEGTHRVTVKTAYELPVTGRNGTTIFAIIGLMIVGVAVTMGYKAKRKDI